MPRNILEILRDRVSEIRTTYWEGKKPQVYAIDTMIAYAHELERQVEYLENKIIKTEEELVRYKKELI